MLPYNNCPSWVAMILNNVKLLASITEILLSLKKFKSIKTICFMKEYSGVVFKSNCNVSGSGCNNSVVKSAGPNIPKQLAARIWIYNVIL